MRALPLLLTAALAAQTPQAPLLGTVVDPDGKPVANAMVEVWRADGKDMNGLDLTYNRTCRRLARVPTSKNGSFGLQLPVGRAAQLRVDVPPFARWVRDAEQPGEPLRIELQQGATFRGKVVLPDGTGTPATIRAWNGEQTEVLCARTAADGTFLFERLPAGAVTVEVEPDVASAPDWARLAFTKGETTEQDFACAVGEVLQGRVTDADTGGPIAGARIGEGWTLHKAVTTDANGNYELRGYGSKGYGDVHIEAEGYVRQAVLDKEIAAGSPRVLDFTLSHGLAATGTVIDPAGKPLQGVYVAAIGMNHDGQNQYHFWVSGRTDAEGRFRLQGIRKDLAPTLLLRQDGFATLVYHLAPARNGVYDAGTLPMRPARIVQGRILDADGKPLARAKVGLWGTNRDRQQFAKIADGWQGWGLLDMYLGLHDARTDAAGHFAFGDLADGDYSLVVYGLNNQKLASRTGITIDADKDPQPIECRID